MNNCLNLCTGAGAGLGAFCLKKAKGDADLAAKIMTTELDDHFKDDYSLQYDVPLIKFMVDWDIKEFLTKYVGITSWDNVSEDDKRKCFKDYPKKSLPVWDEMVLETF